MTTIRLDFTDGTEISYLEGITKKDNFNTHCLDFFFFDNAFDVTCIKKDGTKIVLSDIRRYPKMFSDKEIRAEHNLVKLLKNNILKFR